MLSASEIRTYPCPSCGEIINTGVTTCPYCSAPVDEEAALRAADDREKYQKAFADANSLVITARSFPLAFVATFIPFIGSVGSLGVLLLLVWVPAGLFRWYRRHSNLNRSNPDYAQARRWVTQSLVIWCVALLLTLVWAFFRFGGTLR
jgi:hypothetical protein